MKLKEIIQSRFFEQFSISLLLYSLCLLLLSLVSITIDTISPKSLSIVASIELENLIESDQSINIDNVQFSEEVSVIKDNISSISIPEQSNEPIQISDNLFIEPNQQPDIIASINTVNIDETVNIGNNTVEQNNSVEGVLDRLTPEIVSLAEKKDVHVVWLFDASISLSNQRKQIKDRISKILDEIKETSSASKSISHTICSFGESLQVISKQPSNNAEKIISDINMISLDESGVENIFGSIIKICEIFSSSRNMIIVFTDEVGDDIVNLEKAINITRRKIIPVYVVGPPAPFGLSSIEFKYVDPDPKFDQKERWVQINQGPETLFKMTLDLHTLPIDESGLDSGYGPYGLTRLCYSSGGTYFSVHPNRSQDIVIKKQVHPLSSNISRFFDSEIMSRYRPDYRNYPAQQYEVENNKFKLSLVKACQIPLRITYDQKTSFTAFNEGEFVEQLSDAQNFSAKIEPKIDQVYSLLKNVESFLPNIKEDRWLVSYYLAMGRILATKCRIELYNNILAEAKSGLKKTDKKTNAWELESDTKFSTKNSQLNKYYSASLEYLNLVVTNYPDTPWAAIAIEELNTPMGYRWKEKFIEPTKSGMGNGGNNNNVPKDDQIKKLQLKPQRKIDKI